MSALGGINTPVDQRWPPQGTIRDWLDYRAQIGGTAIVFPDAGASLSWAQLRSSAMQFASNLASLGCEKGESVAILQPNGADGVIAFFGAVFGGYRATMINLVAGADAVGFALDHCDARFASVHETARSLFDAARPPTLSALTSISAIGSGQEASKLPPLDADDHALLMYTSGTTGVPKGVVHTHASLLAGGWTATIAHALTADDRGFCVLPIYHIKGLCVTVMGSLVSGGSLAMVPRFSVKNFWRQIGDTGCSWFSVVPTIISHLLHHESDPDALCKTQLRFGRSASSALAVDVQRAFEKRFGVPIIETMGLTETAAQILSNPLPPAVRKIGSPGIPFGNEIAILSPDMVPCPTNIEGEIAVRGPNVMQEYLNNPEATAKSFHRNWLRTGDLGRIDEDGYVFVTGRLKELIIKGGENIAPREIDEALYSHSDVVEAAAFARPCQIYGERVEAAVCIKDGSELDDTALRDICIQRLGAFKSPDAIHFLPELPKGPSGKIQRLKLAEVTQKAE